ncbi:ACR3 family arsenite efflux transporter [Candidatus Thorarchaeota archaeon]|jgi:ACR3 family arsenite transporter|nr:ACR3 family arsenite efflux transporter [Candidatus Thorarchaeota archaeon]TFG98884.1 MAG: ACR3 family arsenite efflux transporter [Candidatus Thorarchaeota archaeon]
MSESQTTEDKHLSLFEKYLPLWVAVCMLAGIFLSQVVPFIGEAIDSMQFGGISIPIGIFLFLMMYPAMLNIQTSELRKLRRAPKPIILTLFSNWIVAPIVGFVLANLFLGGNPQLIVAIILLSSSPCTAMVLVWGYLAEGNQEQNIINTSLNTATIIFLYAPIVALLTGIAAISIDPWLLFISVLLFIGLPLILGLSSRRYLISTKGFDWFENKYRPAVGKLALIALLSTLVVLFSLNGAVMLGNPDLLVLVSIPLLIGFAVVVGYNLLITRVAGLAYREGVITVIIGSSSHFEIAIATAIAIYGVGSIAALGTTMGLFWEVPIMLGLVYLSKALNKRRFWKGAPM